MKDKQVTTAREEACFEAGIKLGALFHQFIGSPVNPNSVPSLEKAIAEAVMCQPYVKEAKLKIDKDDLMDSLSDFGYTSLNERMLSAEVTVEVKGAVAKAELKWVRDSHYPLMSIREVRD